MTIREAKETLRRAGYHVESMWHIDDVMSRHNVDSETAHAILSEALEVTEEMDLSRTIGWFTSIYPVNIDLKDAEDLSVGIKRVKEHLRAIPKKGMGYGMLRYLTLEGRERLQNKKEPNIVFNYLGQIDASKTKSDLLYLCEDFTGSPNNLKNQRQFLVDINACVMSNIFKIIIIYNKRKSK
ncbi:MAG: hypothetical protein EB127_23970, partial [Alphaproteobacteria bacterium]|nr:hypothetical protein [Alphaproteobacteria bacterium]